MIFQQLRDSCRLLNQHVREGTSSPRSLRGSGEKRVVSATRMHRGRWSLSLTWEVLCSQRRFQEATAEHPGCAYVRHTVPKHGCLVAPPPTNQKFSALCKLAAKPELVLRREHDQPPHISSRHRCDIQDELKLEGRGPVLVRTREEPCSICCAKTPLQDKGACWLASGSRLKPAATRTEKQATAGSEQAYHSLFQSEIRKLRLQKGGRKDNV